MTPWKSIAYWLSLALTCPAIACSTEVPASARNSTSSDSTRVRFDLAKGLSALPWPNDALCWPDDTLGSPCYPNLPTTSLDPTVAGWVASINSIRGWSLTGPIVIPFSRASDARPGPAIDLSRLLEVQRDSDWTNDAIYLIDLETGLPHTLDFPTERGDFMLQNPLALDPSDPHRHEPSLIIETLDERYDSSSRAILADNDNDGEYAYNASWDADSDGTLDVPAMLPGHNCANPPQVGDEMGTKRVLRDRCQADGIVDVYEAATDILRIRPRTPLAPHHEYAVVLTDRLLDSNDRPVDSPFSDIIHPRQSAGATRVLDWVNRPELVRYFGTQQPAASGFVRVVWTFTTASPMRELERLATGLQPDIFEPGGTTSSTSTRVTVEQSHSLDAPCATGIQRLAIAELLAEEFELSPAQQQAILDSYASVATIVTGVLRHQEYPLSGDLLGLRTETTFSSEVPFWLTIPKGVATTSALPVVLVSHEQDSTHLEGLRWAGNWAATGLATLGIEHIGRTPRTFLDRASHQSERFQAACAEGLLFDLMRERRDPTATRAERLSETSIDIVRTRERWRRDAIELATVAIALEEHTELEAGTSQLAPLASRALIGIGTGAPAATLAASLLDGQLTVALIDPATSPERAWRRGATWGGSNSELWQVFGPRLAGVPTTELTTDATKCGNNEASIRLISGNAPQIGVELSCLSLVGSEGKYFPGGANVIATNLTSLSRRCVKMSPLGQFSLGLPASKGDAIVLAVYDASAKLIRYGRDRDCDFEADTPEPRYILGVPDATGATVDVVAAAGGLGLERQSGEFSRAIDLAEAAFSLANPAPFVAELANSNRPSDTRGLLISISAGNQVVPPDEGIALARAANLIPRFPSTNLASYPEAAADTTPEVLARALPAPTPAAHVAATHLDEGVHRLRRFPPSGATCGTNVSPNAVASPLCHPACSEDRDCFGYMTCSEERTCRVPTPTEEQCVESLPDLDGFAGDLSGFGAQRPVPYLRLARYAGHLDAKSLSEHWEPQSRQTGPLVQPTHPDWPFVALALPLADPLGSHGIPRDEVCQRFRFGAFLANLLGRFFASEGTEYPPVTSRKAQHCLAEFPNDQACIAATQGK